MQIVRMLVEHPGALRTTCNLCSVPLERMPALRLNSLVLFELQTKVDSFLNKEETSRTSAVK